jgi:hypothetical protein
MTRSNLILFSATVVYYEDYILRLRSYYERHMELIWREFEDFRKNF